MYVAGPASIDRETNYSRLYRLFVITIWTPAPHFFTFSRSIDVPTTPIHAWADYSVSGADESQIINASQLPGALAIAAGGSLGLGHRLQPAAGSRYHPAIKQRQTR